MANNVSIHGDYEIIDAHAHIYPSKIASKAAESIGNFYNYESRYAGSIEELLTAGNKHGVRSYLVCSVATTPQQVAGINAFLRDECNKHSEFIAFGAMHPNVENPGDVTDEIINLGFHGIKLHPDFQRFFIDDKALYPIYEAASGRLPILFHMGDIRFEYSRPSRLARVLRDFPNLSVIAAHLGGYQTWDEAADCLRLPNVKFDTCSALQLLDKERAIRQIYTLGVENCFFGTDYPLWDYDSEFEAFFALGLPDYENRAILADNFKYFIPAADRSGILSV